MNHKSFILRRLACFVLLFSLFLPRAIGKEVTVSSLKIRLEGNLSINEEIIRSRIKIREGQLFLQELNDESIRALYGTHLFDYVEVVTENGVKEGTLDVIFVLHPKPQLSAVEIEGNSAISGRKLRKVTGSHVGSPLDWPQISKDCEKMQELYRAKGFLDVQIFPQLSSVTEDLHQKLVFRIVEGPRLAISKVMFSGNDSLSAGQLRKAMITRRRRLLSFLDGSGYYRPQLLEDDLERLRMVYKNEGFLDVEILPNEVEFIRSGRKSIEVRVRIHEGPRFFVGNIAFSGNELNADKKLERCLRIHRGEPFSPGRVDATEEAIRYFYGQAGYVGTYVTTERRPDVESGLIHLTFVVHESPCSKVGLISIRGNTKTKNNVILRELSLIPGDTFDLIKMRNSENRLRETRYFEQASIGVEPNPMPSYQDVLVTVTEANTGRFNFGGAVSSIDDIIGYVEFCQSNFDICNRRSKFQGAGQKFRTRFQLGTRTQQALISFEEPWLWQRELAFSSDLFFTQSEYKKSDHNYNGESYDERHAGAEVAVRKRLVELLEGRFYYRLDRAKLYNVGPTAPISLQEDEKRGAQWISKVGLNLLRDSRDSLLYPTVGNKFIGEIAYAGIGGNVNYFDLDFQAGQWIQLSRNHTQVLSLIGKVASIKAFRGKSIPYFDRKFLGGTADMRGFDFHGVGPKDKGGQPLGANSYCYGCLEYSYKIGDPLRLALFCEGAYASEKAMRLSGPFYLDAGVEFRLFVMGSPLRLIFGYPLQGDSHYDHHLQFNFSFGTLF